MSHTHGWCSVMPSSTVRASFIPHTLIAYSYGKVLLTPGERIGWLAMSPSIPNREPFREAIELSQIAAGWLFPNAVLQYAIDDLERLSIDLSTSRPSETGWPVSSRPSGYQLRLPEGTFYLWVRSPDPDDVAFCRRLADRNVLGPARARSSRFPATSGSR